jgi:hypothetical protein
MKKLFIIALAAILFSGCAKVKMDNCYNENTVDKDLASLVKQGVLTDEDASLIKDYATGWNYSISDSISYETLLSDAKAEKDKENRNKEIQKELDNSMSVHFVKKYFRSTWQNQYLVFDIKATNNTDKKVYGFKFSADIKDGAGNTLYCSTWNSGTARINPKSSTIIKEFGIEYDNGDNLSKLRAAELDKLQIDYRVLSIVYDDGTSLEIED